MTRDRVSRGELGVWLGFLLLGLHLFFSEVRPACAEEREQHLRMARLLQDNASLESRLELLENQRLALDQDPDLIQRMLVDRGFTPPGALRLVERTPAPGR